VENQAPKMPQGACSLQLSVKNAVEISVEVQEKKITGLLRGLAENSAYTFHVSQANF